MKLWTAILFFVFPLALPGQGDTAAVSVDTSSFGYKIGYQVGSWLPFLLLAGILIYLTVRAARKGKENPG